MAMAMSMTGFGKGTAKLDERELTVEIKTLNHRYLDVNIRIPRVISFIEEDIRSMVKNGIARGRVEVFIGYSNNNQSSLEVDINKPLLESYLKCFNELSDVHNLKNDITVSALMNISDMFVVNEQLEDESLIRDLAAQAMEEALHSLVMMRENEGHKLKKDILERADLIISMLNEIDEYAPQVVVEYSTKLKERLKELLDHSVDLDENRFNMEVAFFADRCNITEEIVRLNSHLSQLKEILKLEGPVGRKLDFLVQEMNREANTIGSKASDLTITNNVVAIKSEIEKIREQIQNIE